MKDKIEGVKRILECESDLCLDPTSVGADDCGNESHSYACIDCQAHQICQLFEPKPDETMKVIITERTKNCVNANYASVKENLEWLVAKTASIKDAECQERVERIFKEIEECKAITDCCQEDGSIAYRTGDIVIVWAWWQALKKQEGVKDE